MVVSRNAAIDLYLYEHQTGKFWFHNSTALAPGPYFMMRGNMADGEEYCSQQGQGAINYFKSAWKVLAQDLPALQGQHNVRVVVGIAGYESIQSEPLGIETEVDSKRLHRCHQALAAYQMQVTELLQKFGFTDVNMEVERDIDIISRVLSDRKGSTFIGLFADTCALALLVSGGKVIDSLISHQGYDDGTSEGVRAPGGGFWHAGFLTTMTATGVGEFSGKDSQKEEQKAVEAFCHSGHGNCSDDKSLPRSFYNPFGYWLLSESTNHTAASLKKTVQKETQQACNNVLDAFYWQNIHRLPSGYSALPLKIYGGYAEYMDTSAFDFQFSSIEMVLAKDFQNRVKSYFQWKQ